VEHLVFIASNLGQLQSIFVVQQHHIQLECRRGNVVGTAAYWGSLEVCDGVLGCLKIEHYEGYKPETEDSELYL
jgi:hypothetical protein